jgi:hypothetical protein
MRGLYDRYNAVKHAIRVSYSSILQSTCFIHYYLYLSMRSQHTDMKKSINSAFLLCELHVLSPCALHCIVVFCNQFQLDIQYYAHVLDHATDVYTFVLDCMRVILARNSLARFWNNLQEAEAGVVVTGHSPHNRSAATTPTSVTPGKHTAAAATTAKPQVLLLILVILLLSTCLSLLRHT